MADTFLSDLLSVEAVCAAIMTNKLTAIYYFTVGNSTTQFKLHVSFSDGIWSHGVFTVGGLVPTHSPISACIGEKPQENQWKQ